jgi:di/tricarboxylate transporter
MTHEQILSLSVFVLLMIFLMLDRFRYDVVALIALLISVAVGIVSPKQAFSGFSNDIVIIVGSALLVSAGVARSGVMETLIQRIWPDTESLRLQLAFLVISVTLLSAFVKNIGALAIMLPIAFQFARRSKRSPSVFLMPMAYGALLGGLMTQIGTSPNIVVSQIREKMLGKTFSMFDYTPVGAAVAGAGVLYLIFFYWLLPSRTRIHISNNEAMDIMDYVSEATVSSESPIIGKTVTDLMRPCGGEALVLNIIRNKQSIVPCPDTVLTEKDVVLFEGSSKALDTIINTARLDLATGGIVTEGENKEEIDVVEAVITDHSPLIGISAKRLALFDRYEANLLAISRQHERIRARLGEIIFRLGDIIVLQGRESLLPNLLRELKCLPLARRTIMLGNLRRGLIPIITLAIAIFSTAFQLVPVPVAFFSAATAMVVLRVIPGREMYQALDGKILIMLAALIPVSEALSDTGCAQLIGEWLSHLAGRFPPYGALTLILVSAMLVTPFLNNAATVMVMAPIASSFATSLHYRPEGFLMAVAIGAACDFLTPIGHQCNLLVMGPGGYHFSDYPRLGFPYGNKHCYKSGLIGKMR